MAILPRTGVRAVIIAMALGAGPAGGFAAAPQQSAGELPVSLERIREGVQKKPAKPLALGMPMPAPLPTFQVRVEERSYMLTFEERLRRDLELTTLQRQSHEWGSKCCGLGLDLLMKPIEDALQRRKERRIREQVARELAELKPAAAAAKN